MTFQLPQVNYTIAPRSPMPSYAPIPKPLTLSDLPPPSIKLPTFDKVFLDRLSPQSPPSALHEMAILTLGYLSLWGIIALSINVLVRNITFTAEYQTSISLAGGAVVTILTYVNPAVGIIASGILFLIAMLPSRPLFTKFTEPR
jgi:hypothetical protein